MVKTFKLIFTSLLFISVILISGCNSDILGIFGSTDLDTRLKEKDNFVFFSESDRTLLLYDEYSFLVLTDTHIEHGDANGLENLTNVVTSNNIKFIVFTGDITQNGSREDIQKFIVIANSLGVPCYPVIGNHDVYFGNWKIWKELIGSTRYRIDGGNATLFILDSANAYFGKDQLDWLEKEMKTATGRVFVFTHANIFVKSPVDIQQFSDTKERARIVSILHNKCDIMFMGHNHKRIITEVGNVKYISNEDYNSQKAYCIVTVKNNNVSYQFNKL